MGKMIFKLNRKAVSEFMKSEEVQQHLKKIADDAKARCGDGYESDVYVGKNRANAMIWAETPEAKADDSENLTILKNLRG